MIWRVTELKNKEVVNVRDGARLGGVLDIEIDMTDGRVKSIIVPGVNSGGFFFRKEDIAIPFEDIEKAGSDLILVDYETDDVALAKKGKKRFFEM